MYVVFRGRCHPEEPAPFPTGFGKDNSIQNASIKSQKVNKIYKYQEVPETYVIHKALLHVFISSNSCWTKQTAL